MNELLLRYLDDRDGLSADALQTLADHLEQHPAELEDLRIHLAMDELLSRRHSEQRSLFVARVHQAAAASSSTLHVVATPEAFVGRIKQRTGHPDAAAPTPRQRPPSRLVPMAALVIGVLAIGAFFVTNRASKLMARLPVELEVLEATSSLASTPPSGLMAGATLAMNDLYLPAGFLRFKLSSGAEISVTGPAQMQLLNPMHMRVIYGRVTADVGDRAKGFVVDTEQTQIVDLGTKFGVDVSSSGHTDVVVFQGEVELHNGKPPSRKDSNPTRLIEGEAVRVDAQKRVSRIVNVMAGLRDEGWSTRDNEASGGVVASVHDNLRDPLAKNYYRIVPAGLHEDARAFVGQRHEWNGLEASGLPSWLQGADLVQTFVNDRSKTSLEITLTVSRPAEIYVLFDSRTEPPPWLTEGFTDTGVRIGLENAPTLDSGKAVSKGPGAGTMAPFAVWKRTLTLPGSLTLGAPRQEPGQRMLWMYGIAAKPL